MADRPYQSETRGVVIGLHEMEKLRKRFGDLQKALGESTELAQLIGDQQVASAQRRIRNTKRDPRGRRWKPWSEAYRKTRKGQHSLLVSSGSLLDSLHAEVVNPGEVHVGSNLRYAGVHLFGGKHIPQRAYLDAEGGFADSRDRAELRDILRELWQRELKR